MCTEAEDFGMCTHGFLEALFCEVCMRERDNAVVTFWNVIPYPAPAPAQIANLLPTWLGLPVCMAHRCTGPLRWAVPRRGRLPVHSHSALRQDRKFAPDLTVAPCSHSGFFGDVRAGPSTPRPNPFFPSAAQPGCPLSPGVSGIPTASRATGRGWSHGWRDAVASLSGIRSVTAHLWASDGPKDP